MSRSDTWIEQTEVILQDGIVDVIEYSQEEGMFCHFCQAQQSDENIPFNRTADAMNPERHYKDCWVLRVERLLQR